jgi:hypothetical protein
MNQVIEYSEPIKTSDEIIKERPKLLIQRKQQKELVAKAKVNLEESEAYQDWKTESDELKRINNELDYLDEMLEENYQAQLPFGGRQYKAVKGGKDKKTA